MPDAPKLPHRRDPIWKRPLDVVVAALALAILSPIIALVALAVRIRLGAPVLFTQPRPGRDEVVFTLYKFRTMLPPPARNVWESDAARITPLGRFLRSTSLDELPTLFNVLRGDMSLVGPRPLLVEYLPRYSEEQRKRHLVRPGVTGLAQVSGRNALTWNERFALDVQYVERQSLRLDVAILVRTVQRVLRRDGINTAEGTTMPPFEGGEGK